MVLQNGVKNIQAAAYNGARTVSAFLISLFPEARKKNCSIFWFFFEVIEPKKIILKIPNL